MCCDYTWWIIPRIVGSLYPQWFQWDFCRVNPLISKVIAVIAYLLHGSVHQVVVTVRVNPLISSLPGLPTKCDGQVVITVFFSRSQPDSTLCFAPGTPGNPPRWWPSDHHPVTCHWPQRPRSPVVPRWGSEGRRLLLLGRNSKQIMQCGALKRYKLVYDSV